MKTVKCFLIVLLLSFTYSCANDEDLSSSDNPIAVIDNNNPRNQVPCEFDFSSYSPNDEILINCIYDLNGQTITLPENVTLKYDGGNLTNGTIILDGGQIDGRLLNIDLAIEGSSRLISTDFVFEKEKWNITEGQVSDAVALTNKENLNSTISLVKSLRGYQFEINDLDAYFQVRSQRPNDQLYNTTPKEVNRESIYMPSNFHLKMNNNVHLRVQPNNTPRYALISFYDVDNVKVTGGNLWGDRYEHDYQTGTGFNTHEWGFMAYVVASHNITIDGVGLRNGTGDGFNCTNKWPRTADGSLTGTNRTAENVTLSNCIIDSNRRNNLSPVDGNGLIIDGNTISNAGIDGVLPRSGIDFEAWRERDENGNLLEYERIENVIVRNNTFINSERADIVLYTINNIEIYNNTFIGGNGNIGIGNKAAYNVDIHHNTFTGDGSGYGILIKSFVESFSGLELNYNYKVYDNVLSGYENAISMAGKDQQVYNNEIINSKTGIQLLNLDNASFSNNKITSNVANSYGYRNYIFGTLAKDVSISDETINTQGWGILIESLNQGTNSNNGLEFNNCSFVANKAVDMRNSDNITIENSTFESLYQTSNTNITLANNN